VNKASKKVLNAVLMKKRDEIMKIIPKDWARGKDFFYLLFSCGCNNCELP